MKRRQRPLEAEAVEAPELHQVEAPPVGIGKQGLELRPEVFTVRPDLLQQQWAAEAAERPRERVVLRFQPAAMLPALAQHLHDTKHQYGWAHEQRLPDGQVEMTLFIGELPYLATWLLPYAGALTIVEPSALTAPLRALAQRAHEFFCLPA